MSGHGPIQSQHSKVMNEVAELLDRAFSGYGFTLMVFDFEVITGGYMNYISNANRADMVVAMKEFIAAEEGCAHEPPGAVQ
ncbi:hypothetical protein B0G76_1301 [Paraburkholderia sp. BL23I1N1]|uniref:hypothetical protein n=1 Tax=Paraburkholderia sp. BL23I1N1 TaxID=1938802 RepID=UPI000E77124B|nr:hypothetical protein [Paraburkholderia sp. BL23I1N1]RKE35240.1 hypothetical protein B0G76_1301 [Paraburkholderia sp. BL23I1N1]